MPSVRRRKRSAKQEVNDDLKACSPRSRFKNGKHREDGGGRILGLLHCFLVPRMALHEAAEGPCGHVHSPLDIEGLERWRLLYGSGVMAGSRVHE